MLKLTAAAMLLLTSTIRPVLAAEPSPDEAKAIQASIGTGLAFDSNIFNSSVNEMESWIGIVAPAIQLDMAPAQQRYTLLYVGGYGYYFESSADNYDDHLLSGVAQFQFGSRGRVDFSAAAEKGHWARGTHRTDGFDPTSPFFPAEPDFFDRKRWGGMFRYGAEGNRGQLRFGIDGSRMDFTNNREYTRALDYGTQGGTTGLSLFFHQRTAIVFDAQYTDINYENTEPDEASRDSEEWRYLFGLTWEATGRTEGSIRVGQQRRSFGDSTRETAITNPSWDIYVLWSPREDTRFEFQTSRINEESPEEGIFIDSTAYRAAWIYEWRQNWASIVSWDQTHFAYAASPRDDFISEFRLGLRYQQGRLLTWQAGYTRRARDSNLSNLIFDGNLFNISVTIASWR